MARRTKGVEMLDYDKQLEERRGSSDASFAAVYSRLRILADRWMKRERAVQLDATSLVHEAYLRLCRSGESIDESKFFGFAAVAMRRILIERARQLRQLKRGGDRRRVPLSQVTVGHESDPVDLIDLEAALAEFDAIHPGLCDVAVLRFLLGCSVEETSKALGVSTAKVVKDWRFARAWLTTRLGGPR